MFVTCSMGTCARNEVPSNALPVTESVYARMLEDDIKLWDPGRQVIRCVSDGYRVFLLDDDPEFFGWYWAEPGYGRVTLLHDGAKTVPIVLDICDRDMTLEHVHELIRVTRHREVWPFIVSLMDHGDVLSVLWRRNFSTTGANWFDREGRDVDYFVWGDDKLENSPWEEVPAVFDEMPPVNGDHALREGAISVHPA